MDYQLAGNVAVDTGGGGSIGGAIATAVAKHGVTVAAWDVNQSAAELKAYEINSAGGCNKSTTTLTELPFPDLQVDDIAHVFRQNYMGTVISSQLVAKQFIKNNSGVMENYLNEGNIFIAQFRWLVSVRLQKWPIQRCGCFRIRPASSPVLSNRLMAVILLFQGYEKSKFSQ